MDSIIRAVVIYLFLMLVLRISGQRTLNEMTTFDFVLLLILGDAAQQALVGSDYSLINSFLIIITLVLMDVLMSFLKQHSKRIELILDGSPLILINNGTIHHKLMKKAQVSIDDILESARKLRGIEALDQIKYAILEKDGDITVIGF